MTLKAFRIPEAHKTSWWGTYLPAVEWAIADMRSRAQTAIRKI
jgi:hypothetical protein